MRFHSVERLETMRNGIDLWIVIVILNFFVYFEIDCGIERFVNEWILCLFAILEILEIYEFWNSSLDLLCYEVVSDLFFVPVLDDCSLIDCDWISMQNVNVISNVIGIANEIENEENVTCSVIENVIPILIVIVIVNFQIDEYFSIENDFVIFDHFAFYDDRNVRFLLDFVDHVVDWWMVIVI